MRDLAQHIEHKRAEAECVCQRLRYEMDKLGFAPEVLIRKPNLEDAHFDLIKDPYTGTENLLCFWLDARGVQRQGRLQFNSDDSFYAEYDVIQAHPSRPQWFVEGVVAWGTVDNMKAEAKLLPQP